MAVRQGTDDDDALGNIGMGPDTLIGGKGNDTYYVDDAGDEIIELAGEGSDIVYSSVSYTLAADTYIQKFYLTGTAGTHATGNNIDNKIYGNAGINRLWGLGGDDVLNGMGGADTMTGGRGDDSYYVDDALDQVIEKVGEGQDTVYASVSYTLAENTYVQTLVLAGADQINCTGNHIANTLKGNKANNILDGKGGADTMVGGQGDDTYYVDNIDDVVVEKAGQGTDTVYSSVNYAVGDNVYVQYVRLLGSDNLNVAGNRSYNWIFGNVGINLLEGHDGNDVLDGAAGADTMVGGEGNDTYYVDNANDVVVEHLGEGQDTIISTVNFVLGEDVYAQTIILSGPLNGPNLSATGNHIANTLIGSTSSDVLDGKGGADLMIGGHGNDTYIIDNVRDVIDESGDSPGENWINTSVTYVMPATVWYMGLTGSAAIDGTVGNGSWGKIVGNSASNTLTGGDFDDILDGGAGADHMIGGKGQDHYYIENAGDVVVEDYYGPDDDALDLVYSRISYTLGSNLERVTLQGSGNLNGTGNALDNEIRGNTGKNTLIGNEGNDLLVGNGGADKMYGGAGDDTYDVRNAGVQVSESVGGSDNGGIDLIQAYLSFTLPEYFENLELASSADVNGTGNAANNIILGTFGTNILNGRGGDDILTGGLGADTYVFGMDGGDDTVISYKVSENDRLDISGFTGGVENDSLFSQVGGNVVIDFGDGSTVTVVGATLNPAFLSTIIW